MIEQLNTRPSCTSQVGDGDESAGVGADDHADRHTSDHADHHADNHAGDDVSARPQRVMNLDMIADAVRQLLIGIGEDPSRDGLKDTPARVARACQELFGGLNQDPRDHIANTFDISHDELIIVKDIEVWSCCEHHLLPFTGKAHIGYIPPADGRVVGLSKLARIVDVFARRPQVQETLTTEVADFLMTELHARGVIVVMECQHLCMSMRGVHKPGTQTVTSAVRGILRDATTRAEAMSLIMTR